MRKLGSKREILVYPSAERLAADVAARLSARLARVQLDRERATVALTAGGIMEGVWRQLVASPAAADAVDWARVDVFWGDERFVAADSDDRNDATAEQILFSQQPFSSARRFRMAAQGGECGDDMDAAAAAYSDTLRSALGGDGADPVPSFDVVLLGVGPDGHCCSLFPEHPGVHDDSDLVIPVRNSPKPPPNRLSLSFRGLNSAAEVWAVVSGTGKADAVAMALSGSAGPVQVPSGGAQGRQRTLWLLDSDAAAKLPGSVARQPVS